MLLRLCCLLVLFVFFEQIVFQNGVLLLQVHLCDVELLLVHAYHVLELSGVVLSQLVYELFLFVDCGLLYLLAGLDSVCVHTLQTAELLLELRLQSGDVVFRLAGEELHALLQKLKQLRDSPGVRLHLPLSLALGDADVPGEECDHRVFPLRIALVLELEVL